MLKFIKEFIMHPKYIGAVAPSSRFLAQKMIQPINFRTAKCIVEYGPGTGSFTKEIIRQKEDHTILIAIEENKSFYNEINKKYGDLPGVFVIHGSAENTSHYLKQQGVTNADYVISGLPFTSLPIEITKSILLNTQQLIGENGHFITFQYSMVKRKMLEKYFRIRKHSRELRNLPPANVIVMQSRQNL